MYGTLKYHVDQVRMKYEEWRRTHQPPAPAGPGLNAPLEVDSSILVDVRKALDTEDMFELDWRCLYNHLVKTNILPPINQDKLRSVDGGPTKALLVAWGKTRKEQLTFRDLLDLLELVNLNQVKGMLEAKLQK